MLPADPSWSAVMPFDAPQMMLAGLVEIVLPSGTIRLSEGGYVRLGADSYRARDPAWGALGEVESIDEAVGDEAPGMVIGFVPVSAAAAAALMAPANQLAPVRFRLARVDRATGVADPASTEMVADMLLDDASLALGAGVRSLRMGLVSAADRLMAVNEGNVLAARFHKSVWPGEQGLDNAIDAGVTVAWRVKGPPRGSVTGGQSAPGNGQGGGGFDIEPGLLRQS